MKTDGRYADDKIHESAKNLQGIKTRVITYQLPLDKSSAMQKETPIHSRKEI